MGLKEAALRYHTKGRNGKIEVVATKPCLTQWDLSMAYTPGVAEPCREIVKEPQSVGKYTARSNLVAVITNGTAVLGLGNIGALAGKPVMEGKGVLFKRFADIDVFDIELNTLDPDELIDAVAIMEPTFGGINLEDIKAPECFYIEEELKRRMNIPVFHDDQHGTAIISGAALLNALEVVGKRIDEIKVVFSGAGASGIACLKHHIRLGLKKENAILCDSRGVIYKGREAGMNKYKEEFAADTNARTLAEALVDADVFCGLSKPNVLTKDMLKKMADNPVVFAMANPDPEITCEDAMSARKDVIIATGRSDYPNQVNNVLGFPFIFRGALDVEATAITENMKVAATHALADLAKQDVPDEVMRAYNSDRITFGRGYIIPKPFDPRVLIWEASAVAKAAMDEGVARKTIDIELYKEQLEARLGKSREIMRIMINKAKRSPRRIVYPEGQNDQILRASSIILKEKIAQPILIGKKSEIKAKAKELKLNISGAEIIEIQKWDKLDHYTNELYKLRYRKGLSFPRAKRLIMDPTYFGSMMVTLGDADGLVAGVTQQYQNTIRPALSVIGTKESCSRVAGMNIVLIKGKMYVFTDTTVNIDTNPEVLADIAIMASDEAKRFNIEPRVALLSFSNFGASRHPYARMVTEAVSIIHKRRPDINVDGEMNADIAVTKDLREKYYPFCELKGDANVLIFPQITCGNIS